MKILRQGSDVWGECPTVRYDAVLWIEKAGRVCYRSEDKIVEGSGEKFVRNIVKRKHLSVIEHSNLVIRAKETSANPKKAMDAIRCDYTSRFINKTVQNNRVYMGGNYRAWMEEIGVDTLDGIFEHIGSIPFEVVVNHADIPVELKMITAEFLTDRAVTHELVRHRPASYSQESQRYCAYKEELEVILPLHYRDVHDSSIDAIGGKNKECYQSWVQAMEYAEKQYRYLLSKGKRAEQARDILPNSTATRIVMTCTIPEWKWVFHLRTSPAAYPGIVDIIQPVKDDFIDRGLLI